MGTDYIVCMNNEIVVKTLKASRLSGFVFLAYSANSREWEYTARHGAAKQCMSKVNAQ